MAQSKLVATQCRTCSLWFHGSCKAQHASSGLSVKPSKDRCGACERAAVTAHANSLPGGSGALGGLAAAAAAASVAGGGVDQPESERPASRALKAAALEPPSLPPMADHEEAGTLRDGRVYVMGSTLGEHSGLGLFAGVPIKRTEVVTAYTGVPLCASRAARPRRSRATRRAARRARPTPRLARHPKRQRSARLEPRSARRHRSARPRRARGNARPLLRRDARRRLGGRRLTLENSW